MESQIFLVMVGIILGLGMVVKVEGRSPVLHEIGGGRFGWRLDVNFSNWAANQHFYVGDWLYFGFDKRIISVLEVNQTNYKNCIEKDYITNITRGGRDLFNLTVSRPYYFISGRGYCLRGIKLAINVQDAPLHPTLPPMSSDSLTKTSPNSTFITSHATTATTTYYRLFDHFLIMIIVIIMFVVPNRPFAN